MIDGMLGAVFGWEAPPQDPDLDNVQHTEEKSESFLSPSHLSAVDRFPFPLSSSRRRRVNRPSPFHPHVMNVHLAPK